MAVPFSYDDYDVIQVIILRSDGSNPLDIKEMCSSIDLYESIFSPFASASLQIVDGSGFFNRFPITGQETVIISTTVNDKIFSSLSYRVASVEDKEDIRNQYSAYKLTLVSNSFAKNIAEEVNHAYRDKPNKIIDKIFNEYLLDQKPISQSDSATNKIHVNLNYKNPMKAIQMLSSIAISSFADSQDMFFYENTDMSEAYKFKSLGDLYSKGPQHPKYYVDPSLQIDTSPEAGAGHIDINRPYFTYAKIRDASSALKELNKGTYSSKSSTFDITRQLMKRKENNITEEFGKLSIPHWVRVFQDNYFPLEKKFDEHFEALYRIHQHSTELFNPNIESINESNVDTHLGRFTILNGLLGFRLEVRTHANLKFKAGDTIEVGLIAPWQEGPNDSPDPTKHEWQAVKGKFIISGVHHKLTGPNADSYLELSKLGADTNYEYLG